MVEILISPDEFAKRLSDQQDIHVNGAAPPEGLFDGHAVAAIVEEVGERTPPHNIDAEKAVISAVISGGAEILGQLGVPLRPEHFFSEANRRIFEAQQALDADGFGIDEVTTLERLRDQNRISQVGGPEYVISILNSTPAITRVDQYAQIVFALWQERQALFACQFATAQLYAHDRKSDVVLQELRAKLDSLEPKRKTLQAKDVLAQWREEGPLVHESTGIKILDDLTGGGPIYGSRWYVLGAPDAGKTALMLQIGHHYLEQGIAVGFLAVDEEPGDLVQRFAQRMGIHRIECERRSPETIARLERALGKLPVRFYTAQDSIESAAQDLAMFARATRRKAALLVDSIQTVQSAKVFGGEDLSLREIVTENVKALRAVAARHNLIAMATSEMGRAFYRIMESAEKMNDMAGGKESGAIEYSARVLLALRSVKDETDMIRVDIPKNKQGMSGVPFHLRIDRSHMRLTEIDGPSEPDRDALKAEKGRIDEERRAAQVEANLAARKETFKKDDEALELILRDSPGVVLVELRTKMSVRLMGCSRARVEEALERLGTRLRVEYGLKGQKRHYLNE